MSWAARAPKGCAHAVNTVSGLRGSRCLCVARILGAKHHRGCPGSLSPEDTSGRLEQGYDGKWDRDNGQREKDGHKLGLASRNRVSFCASSWALGQGPDCWVSGYLSSTLGHTAFRGRLPHWPCHQDSHLFTYLEPQAAFAKWDFK